MGKRSTKRESEEQLSLNESEATPDLLEDGEIAPEIVEGTIGSASYSDTMSKNYLLYAWSTLLSRALPQIDGLLPVQRRILQAMKDLKLHSNSRYMKSAKVVGETMGKYHPHGDLAIYGALARLAQDFSLRVPLVDGHGNFGSIDGDNPAAPRYTEARLSEPSERLLDDLHPEILPDYFEKNFDESFDEAVLLPARFPNLLINGAYGIGTGMTCLVLPHNPAEMLDLCTWRLKNPEATIEKMIARINGPDFPTGSSIIDDEGLRQSYMTGKGRVTAVAKAHIEQIGGGREKIVITELPWMVNKGDLLRKDIASHADDLYPELASLDDFSDEKIRIEAPLKRGANARVVLQRMFKHTSLRKRYGVEMNCVIDGHPRTLNLQQIVDQFLGFRRYIVVKRAEKRISEIERRLHQLDAYLAVIGATDKVVQTIKKAKDREAAKPPLRKLLKIDDQQASWIVAMQLGSLTKLDNHKIKDEAKELRSELKHFKKLVKTPAMITDVIAEEFADVKERWKKSGLLERRSALVEDSEDDGIDISASTPAEECILMISRSGRALCSQGTLKRGASMNLKDQDQIRVIEEARTDMEYLIFSDTGKAYRARLADLPLVSRRSAGCDIRELIGMSPDEKVVNAMPISDDSAIVLFATASGLVKRVELSEFSNAHSSGVLAMKLDGDEKLIAVKSCPDDADVVLTSNNGKAIRFAATNVRAMGRNAGGVRGMKQEPPEGVVSADVIGRQDSAAFLLLITSGGYAKRVPVSDIPLKNRGGGGVALTKTGGKYGIPKLASIVGEKTEIHVDTGDGKLQSSPAKNVTKANRATVPKKWDLGEDALRVFAKAEA